MKKTITKEVEVKPIMTPNFILVGKENDPISIADFSDTELRALANQFKDNLLSKAQSIRSKK